MDLLAPVSRQILFALAGLFSVLLVSNRRSLVEGARYLRQRIAWQPHDVTPISLNGPFSVCHDLVGSTNVKRIQIVQDRLRQLHCPIEQIPVQDDLPNLLVRFGSRGPYTLFVAHYDLSRETATYQGACDNTAAVAVLLAAAHDLATTPSTRPVAFLFTAAEERDLRGARAFLAWAQRESFPIAAVVNLDMIGRGRLATRPSALPGIYFWLPVWGELVFDGRRLRHGQRVMLPDPALMQRLHAALDGNLIEYQRFSAYSDSNVFQDAGIPTVAVSSDDMAYLDRVWERDTDRIELLDEANLQLARRMVVTLSTGGAG